MIRTWVLVLCIASAGLISCTGARDTVVSEKQPASQTPTVILPAYIDGNWAASPGAVAVPRIESRALKLITHIYDDTCLPSEIGQVSEEKFPLAYREVMYLGQVRHPVQGKLELIFVLRTIYTMLSPRGVKDFLILDSEGEVISRNTNVIAGAELITLRAGRFLSICHGAGLELDLWHTRGLSTVPSWMTTTHDMLNAVSEMIRLQCRFMRPNSLARYGDADKNQQDMWVNLIAKTIEVTQWHEFVFDKYIIDKLEWRIDKKDDFEALAYVRLAGALGIDRRMIAKAAKNFNMPELVERVYKEGAKARPE